MKRSKLLSLLFVLLYFSNHIYSQTPTVQDCLGAIPVCKDVYVETVKDRFKGEGNYSDEIYYPPSWFDDFVDTCIVRELNSVWYTFECQDAGLLRFTLTPEDKDDDYDWIIYDITNHSCADLGKENFPYKSANNYGANNDPYRGLTGAKTELSDEKDICSGPGTYYGNPFNADIPVEKGHIYIMMLSNWYQVESGVDEEFEGYTLDFSSSTANIYDNSPPKMLLASVGSGEIACGTDFVNIRFTERVKCNLIKAENFVLSNGETEFDVVSVQSPVCNPGIDTIDVRDFKVVFEEKLNPGTYTLRYDGDFSDACGNTTDFDKITFEVTGINIIKETKTDLTCFNSNDGSIEINAHSGNHRLSYSIDGGKNYTFFETEANFTELNIGIYPIYVKNDLGCTKKGITLIINQPEEIETTTNVSSVTTCFGDATGKITITNTTGGTSPYQYSISETFSTNTTFDQLTSGIYNLKVVDKNGCKAQSDNEFEIKEPEKLSLFSETVNVNCYDHSDGKILLTSTGGKGEKIFSLNDYNISLSGSYENLSAGEYHAKVTDSEKCESNESIIQISQPDILSFELTSFDVSCHNASNGKFIVDISGGIPDYNINIYKEGNEIIDINLLTPGIYSININDSRNCISDTKIKEITEPQKLESEINVTPVTCNGGSDGAIQTAHTGGTSPYSFLWNNNETTNSISGLKSDDYTLTIVDNNNCKYSLTAFVDQPTDFIATTITQPVSCYGDEDGIAEVYIEGSNGTFIYTWSNNATTNSIENVKAGEYTVRVYDINTHICAEAVARISSPDTISIIFTEKIMSCNGSETGSAELFISGGNSEYLIQSVPPAEINDFSIQKLRPDIYTITAIDNKNCMAEQYLVIEDIICPAKLIVPNIFTPNNDGINDIMLIKGENIQIYDFEGVIYNRWGKEIHRSFDYNNLWDGKIKNTDANTGVYFYYLIAKAKNGSQTSIRGFFHLKRF